MYGVRKGSIANVFEFRQVLQGHSIQSELLKKIYCSPPLTTIRPLLPRASLDHRPPCQSFWIRALVNQIASCVVGEKSPPHDCAIHVLLESMVFQERMLHGEPTKAKLRKF
ncbi:hypothetical protein TNCV_4000571 [Trichonephila clavipes]|nr:hypothetical protein TNCV_4000571 [Trichonephila clavipes]